MAMKIILNGEEKSFPKNLNVKSLVENLGYSGQALAVAVNRQVVPRAFWQDRVLQEQDKVEIVRAIGGG